MFRNVYWHHAVRAATALYKRLVEDAVDAGAIRPEELVGESDERLLFLLETRCAASEHPAARRVAERWIPDVRARRLPKRALELPGEALRGLPGDEWLGEVELRGALERRLAEEMGIADGAVFIDYPEKPRMLGLELLLLRRDGAVQRLTDRGRAGLIDLPRVADELYYTARALRVFTGERRALDADAMLSLLALSADALRARLADPSPLL
jgi:hypothetical protein